MTTDRNELLAEYAEEGEFKLDQFDQNGKEALVDRSLSPSTSAVAAAIAVLPPLATSASSCRSLRIGLSKQQASHRLDVERNLLGAAFRIL